jgi:hypothetical protein
VTDVSAAAAAATVVLDSASRSVRELILEFFEGIEGDQSIAQIVVETGANRNAIDQALYRAIGDGEVIRIDRGLYKLGTPKPKRHAIHGRAIHGKESSEHRAWRHMHSRCGNPNCKEYRNYGARGITVCERWGQFENFLADIGAKPSPKHQIDRFPDNDGPYAPGNVRWATTIEQHNNKRTNRHLTIDGQTLTIAQWARETNIHHRALRERLKRGWDPDWILVPFPGMTFWEDDNE